MLLNFAMKDFLIWLHVYAYKTVICGKRLSQTHLLTFLFLVFDEAKDR